MKIFISHASANELYGEALVELLRGIGIQENEITFTSNVAYGIPIGQNIFDWLKSQINEKPYVIYLLSKEYYSSVACLNEMGAAWMIENEHVVIFVPTFDISSKEFQSGALDPRKIGFYADNEERLLEFIQHLGKYFNITSNSIIRSQKMKKYLSEIKSLIEYNKANVSPKDVASSSQKQTQNHINNTTKPTEPLYNIATPSANNSYQKLLDDIISKKLGDNELLLLYYIIDTSRVKLKTGWQEGQEVTNIKEWEHIKNLNNQLSNTYEQVVRRFEMRGYVDVSAVTSSGNTKEVKLKNEIESNILNLPQEVMDLINTVLENNQALNDEDPFKDFSF